MRVIFYYKNRHKKMRNLSSFMLTVDDIGFFRCSKNSGDFVSLMK